MSEHGNNGAALLCVWRALEQVEQATLANALDVSRAALYSYQAGRTVPKRAIPVLEELLGIPPAAWFRPYERSEVLKLVANLRQADPAVFTARKENV